MSNVKARWFLFSTKTTKVKKDEKIMLLILDLIIFLYSGQMHSTFAAAFE